MNKRLLAIALLVALVPFNTVFAKDLKIGVINLEQIIQSAPQTEQIKSRLQRKYKAREDKIVKAQNQLRKDIDKIKRDSAVMSETDLKSAQERVNNEKRDLAYKEQSFREDFMRSQNSEMESLLKEIRKEIHSIAAAQNYDLILQEESLPFVSKAMDVTDNVIKALKKKKA